MKRHIVLHKKVGETPLQCLESWRAAHPQYHGVPMAYAGRLDPMASGLLLVLIGEECKRQTEYHNLDKAYTFKILFGTHSDSYDVLGIVRQHGDTNVSKERVAKTLQTYTGAIELPYPAYSAKTVQGIPLHTWAVTGKLDEITIPTKSSRVYRLACSDVTTYTKEEIYQEARTMIASLPTVTDERKALGNDFRRDEVYASWDSWLQEAPATHTVATISCIASSGTYMRTLAHEIAHACGTSGLAFSIERTTIGTYLPVGPWGVWTKRFRLTH